ncbi:MAG: mercuric reductase [Planctomycetota bacterium]|jgi:pyruvate/2-oxoglutarate dehydrogenase complex dihydrolipoamide dehydrogenase (E3) component
MIEPRDAHNEALLKAVHPPDWTNPTPTGPYALVVLGAGTAGLVSAAIAAGLGATVALIERELMGGDCLNTGCVPSKALLRTAKAVQEVRHAADLGIRLPAGEVTVDFGAVMERMRRLRAQIAPHDGAERFTGLGVDVYLGDGRFTGRNTIDVGGTELRFRRAVIATGARAAIPPIPGLAEAGYVTNHTVFQLTELPRRLVVIGGGPIGCELAQSFRRFGSEVTLLEAAAGILPRDDPDAAALVRASLEADGVRIRCGGKASQVEVRDGVKVISGECRGEPFTLEADAILVAAGRAPNVESLGAEAAGVRTGPGGVEVDDQLRTDNGAIFAAGDCCSAWKFTHAADHMARLAVRNALFFGRGRVSSLVIPWVTYTDPELAHVGPTAAELRERHGAELRTITVPFEQVDRAILDGATDGFARVHHLAGRGTILAATVVGKQAGELFGELCLAVTHGITLSQLSDTIHAYPTTPAVFAQLGGAYQKTRLTPFVAGVLRWLARRGT